MKMLHKITSMLCLFSLLGTVGPAASAQQTAPIQLAAPASLPTGAPGANEPSKPAADTVFHGLKLADAKGKQADATLTFSDTNKTLMVRAADNDFATIPYHQLDKFSYEYTKKHRVTQGAIVMAASLGAGAIVMLTKSKSHWLYIDYHDQNAPKSVVLRMDKREYKAIFKAVKAHTGKEVEFAKDDQNKQKKKEKNENEGSGQ